MERQIAAAQAGRRDRVRHARPRARPHPARHPRRLKHLGAGARRGRRDVLDGLRQRAQRDHGRAAHRPAVPLLLGHHRRQRPAHGRAAHARAAVHHAVERPGRRRGDQPLLLHGAGRQAERPDPRARGRGPRERDHLLQHQERDRDRRAPPVGCRLQRRLAQRRPAAARSRADHEGARARASCASWWPPTSPRAASTSRT